VLEHRAAPGTPPAHTPGRCATARPSLPFESGLPDDLTLEVLLSEALESPRGALGKPDSGLVSPRGAYTQAHLAEASLDEVPGVPGQPAGGLASGTGFDELSHALGVGLTGLRDFSADVAARLLGPHLATDQASNSQAVGNTSTGHSSHTGAAGESATGEPLRCRPALLGWPLAGPLRKLRL